MSENLHLARSAKIRARCPDCIKSTRPGLLWLGGTDWVECPTCDPKTPGLVPIVVTEMKAPPKRNLVTDNRIYYERRDWAP